MYVMITLGLLVLATAIMVGLRLSRISVSYSWLTAALGGLLGWITVLTWQLDLPHHFSPSTWAPVSLFASSPALLAEPYAWLYAVCLVALAAAVILTSPARTSSPVNPASWAGTLALTALGLLAVLADNPLSLVLGWTAIDLTEFFNTLRASDSPSLSERTVISFAIRAAGTGFALYASVVSAANGQTFLFEKATAQTGIFLLLAVGLRLGVLPLHLTYRSEPVLRRGFGTVLRLLTAATSLIVLARMPASALDPRYIPYLLIFVALAALYGGWQWLFSPDELNGRPYWIIGMSALSIAANLRGSSSGSAAWGAALVLFGGISFLYSARQKWFTRVFSGLGILLLALPFTLTSTGWTGDFVWPGLFWPLFLAAHFMLVAGYIRHLSRAGEAQYSELPTWAQSAYPMGLAILVLTAVLTGLWGWPGALKLGLWAAGAVVSVLCLLAGLAVWRFKRFAPGEVPGTPTIRKSRLGDLLEFLGRIFWGVYRLAGRLFNLGDSLLEGDGGLLWTLLLLVLFIIIYRGR